ncbi:M23 family metallopeptidase [Papillibacter cinnamivorans]|uniref:Peptidase family M23 n=1 Tax=Papillibacter cinnamivorans DSM 12816 TaxID=1122930 RepID=A0A1W1YV34_9FIRM|nr:M23 family metallopeptidase [Papillibacter cinnamivorans]SMC39588.1 Peptidase family M23 [Papillibacter cinnamivorans DSM 12816]
MQTGYRARTARPRSAARMKTKRSGKTAALGKKEKRRMIQLIICAGIFLVMVAAKIVYPAGIDRVRGDIMGVITQDVDYKAAFSSIGRAIGEGGGVTDVLSRVYVAVVHPGRTVAVSGVTEGFLSEQDYLSTSAGDGSAILNRRVNRVFDASAASSPEAAQQPEAEPIQASSESETAEITHLSAVIEVEPAYSGPALPDGVSLKHELLGITFTSPLKGEISSPFGYREHPVDGGEKFHYGIDLAADTGAAVGAFADGKVIAVGDSSSLGKYLEIEHAGGVTTLYAHCSKICVSAGQSVAMGSKVAEVGNTGISTGPHLHFEVHLNGIYLNPAWYLTTV